jgi:ATP-dependent Clp protease adaptor protein ClpS
MADVAVKSKTKNSITTEEPKKFNVVFMNDNVTSMDFVIQLLEELFGYDSNTSYGIMMLVHEQGQAVVATYYYELAEQRALECTYAARRNGYPLEVKIKPV